MSWHIKPFGVSYEDLLIKNSIDKGSYDIELMDLESEECGQCHKESKQPCS